MNKRHIQLVIWCIAILVLVSAFLYSWLTSNQTYTEQAVFDTAKREMLTNANSYKQLWLLSDRQPSISVEQSIEVEGKDIFFNPAGWPYSYSKELNCDQWLKILWSQQEIFGFNYQVMSMSDKANDKMCYFLYDNNYYLTLELIGKQILITTGIAE